MIRILAAGPDGCAREERLDKLPALLASTDIVWVDLQKPTAEEALVLARDFKFHPLAIDACLAEANHPKIDDYESYLYIIVHGITQAEKHGELKTAEIDCFLGPRFVVTVHDGTMTNVEEVFRRALQVPGFMGRGADWLMHGILDRLADTYLDLIEKLDEEIDGLERTLFHAGRRPGQRILAEVFSLKKDILHLKRVVHPARDVFARIARGDYSVVRKEVAPHFRDVYDHIVRTADMIESFRDVLTSALETYLSVVSQRTNEIMKVLTVMSAILMTTSLMAGIYGMNFDALPGKSWTIGFWAMLGVMGLVSGIMLILFRRQKWL